jgi:hypothetical protein
VPDRRQHRGPHPGDRQRFAPDRLADLRAAGEELAWLLTRSYSEPAARKLVGDRWQLDARQRMALMRATCSDQARERRAARRLGPDAVRGAALLVDGFNVLTTVEAALGGSALLRCRDGTLRDLASMHGTWRRVAETEPAATLVGVFLGRLGVAETVWLLDRPVSNAGRLAGQLRALAATRRWPWRVEVVPGPDRELRTAAAPIASADGPVLDACGRWLNLARLVVEDAVPDAWLLSLDGVGPPV